MDDFAHLLLGYLVFKALLLAGAKVEKLELAASLFGALAPDIAWSSGLQSNYAVSHVATYYVLFALPFMLSRKARMAAICFALAAAAHIVSDAPIHLGTWIPFYPLAAISIAGSLNYWEHWWAMATYWALLLAALAGMLLYEKKKTGRISIL